MRSSLSEERGGRRMREKEDEGCDLNNFLEIAQLFYQANLSGTFGRSASRRFCFSSGLGGFQIGASGCRGLRGWPMGRDDPYPSFTC